MWTLADLNKKRTNPVFLGTMFILDNSSVSSVERTKLNYWLKTRMAHGMQCLTEGEFYTPSRQSVCALCCVLLSEMWMCKHHHWTKPRIWQNHPLSFVFWWEPHDNGRVPVVILSSSRNCWGRTPLWRVHRGIVDATSQWASHCVQDPAPPGSHPDLPSFSPAGEVNPGTLDVHGGGACLCWRWLWTIRKTKWISGDLWGNWGASTR